MVNKKALLEACLFVSNKPLTINDLCKILNSEKDEVKYLIEELKKELENEDRGIFIFESLAGYELKVKPLYIEHVKGLSEISELSEGMLKTLALIIIKENPLQSEIVKVQGNKVYDYLKTLEEMGFIKREKQGRTKIIKLTNKVETYFGKNLTELKEEILKNAEYRNL